MTQGNAALEQGDSQEQLNRAIEELRGVLEEEEQQRPADGQPAAFAPAAASGEAAGSSLIMGIPVEVQIMLGSAEMAVSDLIALQKGSTVALDRRVGEPVDVMVNGRRIARGEITVLENDPSRFGIRLTEISTSAKSG